MVSFPHNRKWIYRAAAFFIMFIGVGNILNHLSAEEHTPSPKSKPVLPLYTMDGRFQARVYYKYLRESPGITNVKEGTSRETGIYLDRLRHCASKRKFQVQVRDQRVGPLTSWSTLVNIEERVHLNLSQGGSSFIVTVQEDDWLVYSCPVEDYFNGSYTAYCPTSTTKSCLNIQVTLDFCDFLAFQVPRPDVTALKFHVANICHQVVPPNISQKAELCATYTGWTFTNKTWTWITNGSKFIYLTDQELQRCFKDKVTSLVSIGDSHMRFMHDFFMMRLGLFDADRDNIAWKHKHFSWENGKYMFRWARFGNENAKEFRDLEANRTTAWTDKNIILFWNGAWDIENLGERIYIEDTAKDLLRQLKALTSDIKSRDARVIWLNILPYPNNQIASRRSNVVIRSVNNLLRKEIVDDLGIEEIDCYSFVFPRQDENISWHHHYLERTGNKPIGTVGRDLGEMILKQICSVRRE